MASARKFCHFPGRFEMRRGGYLDRPVFAYETWGKRNESRDNAVLIFTGMSPSAHATSSPADPASGWWEEMVGPSRPINTRHYFVICVNSLGSCFGSTGPASIDPATGKPYGVTFPVLSLEDVASAGKFVVEEFGIGRLHTVVGPSMGGMSTLAFAILFPDKTRNLALFSTAARSLPFSIAMRSLQRELIRRDPDWQNGNYPPGAGPIQGMRMARKLGLVTYRSAREWEQRFGREHVDEERQSGNAFAMDFEIEAYLEAHAAKFIGQFDANSYLYLSRASDLFDVAEHGGSVAAGLARIRAERVLIVGVETDTLFPIAQQRELASGLSLWGREVNLVELPSIQGHDSFLVDMDRFRPVVETFFQKGTGP